MKKLCAILVCLSMMLYLVPAAAFAESSKGLEEAIVSVKSVVDIPSAYNDFTYSDSTEGGNHLWYLEWRQKDQTDSGYISAVVNQDGILLSYYKYVPMDKEGLSDITSAQGKTTADAFLKKAMPNEYANLKAAKTTGFAYTYTQTLNDIEILSNNVTIAVNKYNGEVSSFDRFAPNKLAAPTDQQLIGIEAAKTAYLEKFGVEPIYAANYDYKTKIMNVFPAYRPIIKSGQGINGTTGDRIKYALALTFGANAKTENAAADAGGGSSRDLSAEEISAVQQAQNFISKSQAETSARNIVPGLTSAYKMERSSLNAAYYDKDAYTYSMTFTNDDSQIYASVNAKNGKLVAFNVYTKDSKNQNVSLDTAQKEVEAFVKKAASDQLASLKLEENDQETTDNNRYYFHYDRLVNDIKFIDNGVSVTYDSKAGQITSYNLTWYDNVSFPQIQNPMAETAIFDKMADALQFNVYYVADPDGKQLTPVYLFKENYQTFFDPANGQRLDNTGKVYQDGNLPDYTDIKGHWCEATIHKLLENGIYLQGETFQPDQAITQADFLRYLFQMPESTDSDLYQMLIRQKVLTEDEKNPNATISKLQATKFIVRYLGFEKVAQATNIFQYPFQDSIEAEAKGYIAICYGLEIVSGGSNNKFQPDKEITRAEAAAMVFRAKNI